MKQLDQLIELEDPALPLVQALLDQAQRPFELLAPGDARARVLLDLQVTTRSTLGAIAYETGGLLIDHGWLRVLGGGHPRLNRNLADWSKGRAEGYLLVADDVAGGFFAINGGGLGQDPGALYYWAPDTLMWEALEIGYSDFLGWALSDQLSAFYEDLRWPTWREDLQAASADQCFSFFPFLWTREGSVQGSSRKVVDIAQQYAMNVDLARQLNP